MEIKHFGDICKLSGYDLPVVDCITGGSPCQDLSVAGAGAGLDGERSGLFMEQIRIVKEMRERDRNLGRTGRFIRPRYMVWENVPGAFSCHGGRDFQIVLTEIVKIAEPDSPIVPMPNRGGGRKQDASTMEWQESGLLLGEYMTASFGVLPSVEVASHLSQILEECPLPTYSLSAKACLGILRRAAMRGKVLPEKLEQALLEQAGLSHFKNVLASRGGKGILIQNDRVGALSTLNNQMVYDTKTVAIEGNGARPSHLGGGTR